MTKGLKMLGLLLLAGFIASGSFALTVGNNITIYDGQGWTIGEDNEVEPHAWSGQEWDIDGLFMNGSSLSLVAGFDLRNGQMAQRTMFYAGDIWLDFDGDAQIPGSAIPITQNFGYEVCLSMNWAAPDGPEYTAYVLSPASVLLPAVPLNDSNPYALQVGGESVYNGLQDVAITYLPGMDGSEILDGNDFQAVQGWNGNDLHNVAVFDLSPFAADWGQAGDTVHVTLSCGNDSGYGRIPVPDGGATLALLGLALVAVCALARKR